MKQALQLSSVSTWAHSDPAPHEGGVPDTSGQGMTITQDDTTNNNKEDIVDKQQQGGYCGQTTARRISWTNNSKEDIVDKQQQGGYRGQTCTYVSDR